MAQDRGQKRIDLTSLLATYGTWSQIPLEAWRAHDQALATYRATMHKVIRTSTVAAGVHLVANERDYKRFINWLEQHKNPREVARAIWKALRQPDSRVRLEDWMRAYLKDAERE